MAPTTAVGIRVGAPESFWATMKVRSITVSEVPTDEVDQ
jgi:hypothetical protein